MSWQEDRAWDALSADEKIERLRGDVLRLTNVLQEMQADIIQEFTRQTDFLKEMLAAKGG